MKNLLLGFVLLIAACGGSSNNEKEKAATTTPADTVNTKSQTIELPEPYATKSVRNTSKVIEWKTNKPIAPAGFEVSLFADNLDNPRWIYQAANGDVFVSEANTAHSLKDKVTGSSKSANTIVMFRDADKDGIAEQRYTYLTGLNMPFGILVLNNKFYVANTDGVVEYPYEPAAVSITKAGKQIISLPAGPRHWTRNIVANADGSKIYIAVGSSSNYSEDGMDKETRRANILEINADGSGERIYASGLRNPVGMAWAPGTKTLWTTVNERDELGDNLVPDYLTSVKDGGFYGWPYSYYGNHKDPRIKEQRQDLIDKAIVPDVPLDNHTASLGLAFYTKDAFPAKYKNGAFIGQHGSWNRAELAGYKVVFVPFANGKPSGKPEEFLTGFIADKDKSEVYGRPVGVAVLQDGSMLVADDAGNRIWRITVKK